MSYEYVTLTLQLSACRLCSSQSRVYHTGILLFHYATTAVGLYLIEQNRKCMCTLTSACWVHSNVYGLGNIHCIRYLTAVDPFHSTSSAVQKYHHLTSGSVEIPLATWTGNSSSIGKEPVPYGTSTSIRRSTTSSLVSFAEQGIFTTLTNVLQDHDTVVLVCCISEWEPDITCTQEGRDIIVVRFTFGSV